MEFSITADSIDYDGVGFVLATFQKTHGANYRQAAKGIHNLYRGLNK